MKFLVLTREKHLSMIVCCLVNHLGCLSKGFFAVPYRIQQFLYFCTIHCTTTVGAPTVHVGAGHLGAVTTRCRTARVLHNWVRLQLGAAELGAAQLGAAKLGAATTWCDTTGCGTTWCCTTGCGYILHWVRLQLGAAISGCGAKIS
jgi:hypothetical protein